MTVISARVFSIRPHPNADRLEIASLSVPGNVLEWTYMETGHVAQAVVRKDEFKPGTMGLFFRENSVIPEWLHSWLFPPGTPFTPRNQRINKTRIRGVVSDGLLIRINQGLLDLVREWNPASADQPPVLDTTVPGHNWTKILGVSEDDQRVHCVEHPHLSREADARIHADRFRIRGSRSLIDGGHERELQDDDEAKILVPRATTPLGQYVSVLTGVLVLLAVAMFLGNAPLMVLGVFVLALATLGLPLRAPSSPSVERTIGKSSYWADEEITVEWSIKLESGNGAVLIYDELPEEIELVGGTNLRLFWKQHGPVNLSHSYTIRCPRRGVYELGPTQWETRHPLALRSPIRGVTGEKIEITVLPKMLGLRRIRNVRAMAVTPLPMAALARLGIETNDFKEIRQYAPGDPMRIINWKATARRVTNPYSPPLVNQYEFEGKKAVWMFVDSSAYMGVGTTVRSPLEQVVEAASALGNYYLWQGYRLGAHFSSRSDFMLPADTGRNQLFRLTNELLALEPEGPRYDLLAAIEHCQRPILTLSPRCIILTRLDMTGDSGGLSPEADAIKAGVRKLLGFSRSRRSRISVWVVGVRGYGYVESSPGTAGVATAIRALETRPFLRELQRTGAVVLDWDPASEPFTDVLVKQLRRERSRR